MGESSGVIVQNSKLRPGSLGLASAGGVPFGSQEAQRFSGAVLNCPWPPADPVPKPVFVTLNGTEDLEERPEFPSTSVSNCLIFHNVCSLTRVIGQLQDEREDVPEAALACVSPALAHT